MNDGQDDFIPYWLQTGSSWLNTVQPFGADLKQAAWPDLPAPHSASKTSGRRRPSSRADAVNALLERVMYPWEYPWPHTLPRDMWAEATQPNPSAALPPTFPPEHLDSGKYWPVAPPVANDQPSAHGFYVPAVPQAPSWDSVPTYSADSTTPGLPQPPYWDSAASPHSALKTRVNALLEHPDSARYWGAPAASHSASKTRVNALLSGESARPPTGFPTWLPTAEWKAPEAAPRLSFSGPDRAPTVEPSWDHLWPTGGPAPKTWHQQSLDALQTLDEGLWYVTPPELRPKVSAVLAFLRQIAPGSGTADSMEAGAAAEDARRDGRYGAYAGNLAAGMFSAASDWIPPLKAAAAPIAKALIVGGSAISPAKRLEAEVMESAGKSVDEIWRKTRLERGPDRQWITEISDAGYRVVPEGRVKPLYEHHVHPAAKETFPELGQIESHLRIRPRMIPEGKFQPGKIEVRAPDLEVARRVGIEELQHAIDHRIRHPRGGSVTEFLAQGLPYPTAYNNYWRQAGEARARVAVKRLLMGEEERLAKPPSSMEWPPRDRQIIRYRDE